MTLHSDIPEQQQKQQQHTHTISLRALHTSNVTTAIFCCLVKKGMQSGQIFCSTCACLCVYLFIKFCFTCLCEIPDVPTLRYFRNSRRVSKLLSLWKSGPIKRKVNGCYSLSISRWHFYVNFSLSPCVLHVPFVSLFFLFLYPYGDHLMAGTSRNYHLFYSIDTHMNIVFDCLFNLLLIV
jgi:hypothetical protein